MSSAHMKRNILYSVTPCYAQTVSSRLWVGLLSTYLTNAFAVVALSDGSNSDANDSVQPMTVMFWTFSLLMHYTMLYAVETNSLYSSLNVVVRRLVRMQAYTVGVLSSSWLVVSSRRAGVEQNIMLSVISTASKSLTRSMSCIFNTSSLCSDWFSSTDKSSHR